MPSKLNLKRTPAEEEYRAYKKAKKAAKKAKKHASSTHSKEHDHDDDTREHRDDSAFRAGSPSSSYHKHSKKTRGPTVEEYTDSEPEIGPQPSTSSSHSHSRYHSNTPHHADFNPAADDYEDEWTRKMMDATEDDVLYGFGRHQQLDEISSRLNSYAHVPRRWRGTDGYSAGFWMEEKLEEMGTEPWQMNDDEYAEWIREGMYRRKNEAEYKEKLRRRLEREAREEEARIRRKEAERFNIEVLLDHQTRKVERSRKKVESARREYEEKWAWLMGQGKEQANGADDSRETTEGPDGKDKTLYFEDVPWPVFVPRKDSKDNNAKPITRRVTLEDITMDAVSSFLFVTEEQSETQQGENEDEKPETIKMKRDTLRATMLRYHPDKFEARVLKRVREKDRGRVEEISAVVVRTLNDMMSGRGKK